MNKGLSDELKEAFPNTKNLSLSEAAGATQVFILKPADCQSCSLIPPSAEIPSPFWLSGFTSGQGSFRIKLYKSSSLPPAAFGWRAP
jgi:hypothetical protein